MTFTQIGKEIGISRESVKYYMKKVGITKSIPDENILANYDYPYDITYFEKIDNSEKAYILGLFYADGNTFSNSTHSKVSLTLHKNDICLLEKINTLFGSKRPIRVTKMNASVLNLSGKLIFDQLVNLGCVPRKSLILTFPTEEQVPKEFQSHFIRGYFDGDGYVGLNGKALNIIILGTKNFLIGIQNFLLENNIKSTLKEDGSIYRLGIFSKSSIIKFQNLIYNNSIIHLDRKYNKFINHFKL